MHHWRLLQSGPGRLGFGKTAMMQRDEEGLGPDERWSYARCQLRPGMEMLSQTALLRFSNPSFQLFIPLDSLRSRPPSLFALG